MNRLHFLELDQRYGMDIKLQTLTDKQLRWTGQLFAARSTYYDKMLFFKNNPEYAGIAFPALELLRRYESANYETMTDQEKDTYGKAFNIMSNVFDGLLQNPVVLKRYHHGLTQGVYINTSPLDSIQVP